jgi:cytochrome P450
LTNQDSFIGGISALSDTFRLSNEQLEKTLRKARAESPVSYLADIGYWAVTRFDDIKKILRDKNNFSAEITLEPLTPFTPEVVELLKSRKFSPRPTLSNNTRDDHARIRRHTQAAFAPNRIGRLEPYIRQLVRDAVANFGPGKRANLVSQMVYELPALVLFKLLGIPDADVSGIKSWADDRLALTFGKLEPAAQLEAAAKLADYWDYCVALVQQRIKNPGDDLPSEMLSVRGGDDSILTIEDITNVVFGLLLAGHETTTNASANAILTLLQHPDTWQMLVKNKELIPDAVEEILRFRPPVVAWRRLVKNAMSISGTELSAGDRVLCFLASGNRDETVFEDGESFDIRRENARAHVAFGCGAHFCLGAPLARMELILIIEELTQLLPRLRLAADQSFHPVETVQFRGPKELWVEW